MDRIKIGCNWSEELGALLERGRVQVDYIKAGDFGDFDRIFPGMRRLRPVLLHGLGYSECTGMPDPEKIDFNRAGRLIAECGSPHYGLHLAIRSREMETGMTQDDIAGRMGKTIGLFQKSIGVPLLLENIPDTPEERTVFGHFPFSEPDQIRRIVEDNGTFLLLDMTHAKVTAKYWGMEPMKYLRGLPLDRLAEIHVNGSGYDAAGFPSDTHQSMEEEDFILLKDLLREARPKIVTLEYTGIKGEDSETISRSLKLQLDRINELAEG